MTNDLLFLATYFVGGGPHDGKRIVLPADSMACCIRSEMGRWHTWYRGPNGKMFYIGIKDVPSGEVICPF